MELLIKNLKVPIYGGKIIVVLFKTDIDKVNKYLKRKGFIDRIDKDEAGIQAQQLIKNKMRFLLIVKRGKDELETLLHEIWHLNQSILEYNGVDYRRGSNNEAYAYLMGVLSKKLLPLLSIHEADEQETPSIHDVDSGQPQVL